MGKVAILTIGFFSAILTGTQALRDVRINVPSAVVRGDDAVLECYFDLEGDPLYAVKWYLGNTEFYRYTLKENPQVKQFPSNGLTVREHLSNDTRVVLAHVPMSISGRYTCEVSADAPSFYTAVQSDFLQVVDLPRKDPYITGMKTRYHHGDILKANCTSEHSNPAAILTWYINGIPANRTHVRNYDERSPDGLYHTAHSTLRLKITKQSFIKHNLKIRCAARMYDIYYKSTEKSVEAEKKRHHHHFTTSTTTTAEFLLPPQAAETNPETKLVFHVPSDNNGAPTPPITSIVVTVVILAMLMR